MAGRVIVSGGKVFTIGGADIARQLDHVMAGSVMVSGEEVFTIGGADIAQQLLHVHVGAVLITGGGIIAEEAVMTGELDIAE